MGYVKLFQKKKKKYRSNPLNVNTKGQEYTKNIHSKEKFNQVQITLSVNAIQEFFLNFQLTNQLS